MGKTTFLLLFFVILTLFAVPVLAINSMNETVVVYYPFDSSGTDVGSLTYNGTITSTGGYDSVRYMAGNASLWVSPNGLFNTSAVNTFNPGVILNQTSNFTVAAWCRTNVSGGFRWCWEFGKVGATYQNVFGVSQYNNMSLFFRYRENSSGGSDLNLGTILGNQSYLVVITRSVSAGTYRIEGWINGSLRINATDTQFADDMYDRLFIGMNVAGYPGTPEPWTGNVDEFGIWKTRFTQKEVDVLMLRLNCSAMNMTGCASLAPSVFNFTVGAKDPQTLQGIQNISAVINLSTGYILNYSTTTGLITTALLSNDTSLPSVRVFSTQSPGYYDVTYRSYDVSMPLNATLLRSYLSGIAFSGNVSYNTTHSLVRTLRFDINVTTCYENGTIRSFVSGVNTFNVSFACSPLQNVTVNSTYQHATESTYNITFDLVSTYDSTQRTGNTYSNLTSLWNFTEDLYPPNVYVTYSYMTNFTTNLTANFSLRCQDKYSLFNITYNLTDNGVGLIFSNTTNNLTLNTSGMLADGTNILVGVCSDIFSSNSTTVTFTAFSKALALVNEITGLAFNISNVNVTYARLWIGDNATFFDFKIANVTNINIRTENDTALRLELGYVNAVPVVSYINIRYTPETTVRMCAKDPGLITNQQLLVSSVPRLIVLKNSYGDCYVAADYTQFAYQATYVLQAITLNSKYYLYTNLTSGFGLLASLDGSIPAQTNIETLIANLQSNISVIYGESLYATRIATNQYQVNYYNAENSTTNGSLLVTRTDNNSVVATVSSFANPNLWTYILDTSAQLNVTNETVFKITYTYTIRNVVYTQTRYVSPGAQGQAVLPTGVGIVISLMVLFFGLTAAAPRVTMSWWGILIELGAIIVLSLTAYTWYVGLLMAAEFVILLFTMIYLSQAGFTEVIK